MKGNITCPQCNHEFDFEVPDGVETTVVTCPQCTHSCPLQYTCPGDTSPCRWEEHGEPRKTVLSSRIHLTNKPLIAAVLLLLVGILGIVSEILYESGNQHLLPELGVLTSLFPLSSLDKIFISRIFIVFSIFALLGSYLAFKRRWYTCTSICASLSIFSIGLFLGHILGILALWLILISRDEFENGTTGKVF